LRVNIVEIIPNKEPAMEKLKLDNIRQDIRKIIEPYLCKLLNIHKDNIVSILLYGSATGKFYIPKQSDINLMIVLNNLFFNDLRLSLKLVNQGIRKKITAPLFLSLEHIQTSKDVFPVEFLEIKENNILLYGRDLFKNMDIDLKHVRLFCEREIKGKLIRLRQAYLEVGLKRKGIEALLKESLNSLLPIFRALIRLKGQSPDVDKFIVLKDAGELYGVDKGLFEAILKDKMNDEKIAGQAVEIFFEKYLDQIKKLALIIDKL
jgi:predicted nucleotidyltransferase